MEFLVFISIEALSLCPSAVICSFMYQVRDHKQPFIHKLQLDKLLKLSPHKLILEK